MNVCFQFGPDNTFNGAKTEKMITLEQRGANGRFTVTYGLQRKTGLTYSEAAAELGAAIMHWQACNGLLGNEGP